LKFGQSLFFWKFFGTFFFCGFWFIYELGWTSGSSLITGLGLGLSSKISPVILRFDSEKLEKIFSSLAACAKSNRHLWYVSIINMNSRRCFIFSQFFLLFLFIFVLVLRAFFLFLIFESWCHLFKNINIYGTHMLKSSKVSYFHLR